MYSKDAFLVSTAGFHPPPECISNLQNRILKASRMLNAGWTVDLRERASVGRRTALCPHPMYGRGWHGCISGFPMSGTTACMAAKRSGDKAPGRHQWGFGTHGDWSRAMDRQRLAGFAS